MPRRRRALSPAKTPESAAPPLIQKPSPERSSEVVTFLISLCFRGRKALKRICQPASSGPSTAAINPLLSDRSARRFAQDDGLGGEF